MDPLQVPVKDLMRTDVITVGPQTTLKEAAKLMATKWIRHLPVVEGSKVVGILSQRLLLRETGDRDVEDRLQTIGLDTRDQAGLAAGRKRMVFAG